MAVDGRGEPRPVELPLPIMGQAPAFREREEGARVQSLTTPVGPKDCRVGSVGLMLAVSKEIRVVCLDVAGCGS